MKKGLAALFIGGGMALLRVTSFVAWEVVTIMWKMPIILDMCLLLISDIFLFLLDTKKSNRGVAEQRKKVYHKEGDFSDKEKPVIHSIQKYLKK